MEKHVKPRLLRRQQVESITGLKRSSIYNRLNPRSKQYDASFPRPITLSSTKKGSVAWVVEEVYAWVSSKIAASRLGYVKA